jgi:hypothetical protein
MTEVTKDGEIVSSSVPAGNILQIPPVEVLHQAMQLADLLGSLIEDNGWYIDISGNPYAKVDAWTALGSAWGVYPRTKWVQPLEDGNGFRAYVEAVTSAGVVIGGVQHMCSRRERNWRDRDDFALLSMAQTRGAAKVLASSLRFIMAMAKLRSGQRMSSTPADEMPRDFKPGERDELGVPGDL